MEMSAYELRQDYAAFDAWDEDQHNDPDVDAPIEEGDEDFRLSDAPYWYE